MRGVVPLSPGEMIAIEVDTGTYIADGLLTHNSLRKWARLALNGNPTVLILLFVPWLMEDGAGGPPYVMIVLDTNWGKRLRDLAPAFVSKRAGRAFLGYLTAQKERMTGDRGQKRTKREDLVCRWGYDVKYAMHAFRLGCQGVELLETGRITLPMPEPWRGAALAIRQGKTLLPVVTSAIASFEERLTMLLKTSPVPDEPDYEKVNRFLIETYRDYWNEYY